MGHFNDRGGLQLIIKLRLSANEFPAGANLAEAASSIVAVTKQENFALALSAIMNGNISNRFLILCIFPFKMFSNFNFISNFTFPLVATGVGCVRETWYLLPSLLFQ